MRLTYTDIITSNVINRQGQPSKEKHAKTKRSTHYRYADQYVTGELESFKNITEKDLYHRVKSQYTGRPEIFSYRRNFSHRCVATFKKRSSGTVDNIDTMLCNFLELDSTSGELTQADVLNRCRLLGLSVPTYVIETSKGRFHVLWMYERPLEWTDKNANWWKGVQSALIRAFEDFSPDKGACMNPVQLLRNPSQLNPVNHKHGAPVEIDMAGFKTNLKAIYKALRGQGFTVIEFNYIPLARSFETARTYLRENKTFSCTYRELGERLGIPERTLKRIIPILERDGELIKKQVGNNKGQGRQTTFESLIFSEVPKESLLANRARHPGLAESFCGSGALVGSRNRTVFACALELKRAYGLGLGVEPAVDILLEGAIASRMCRRELMQTVRSALKDRYTKSLSRKKLSLWGVAQ